jgi:transketolase
VSVKRVRYRLFESGFDANITFAAISLAGHLGLDNLILIYDNNSVTVDGNIDSCFSEDTSAKLTAQGWHVIEVDDGSNDVSSYPSIR